MQKLEAVVGADGTRVLMQGPIRFVVQWSEGHGAGPEYTRHVYTSKTYRSRGAAMRSAKRADRTQPRAKPSGIWQPWWGTLGTMSVRAGVFAEGIDLRRVWLASFGCLTDLYY